MNVLKYIGQILGSVIYTFIITWLLSWLFSFVFRWMITLSTGWMIVLIIVGLGVLFGLITGLGSLGVMLYFLTNKDNIVAVILSVLITAIQFIYWDISIWRLPHDNSFVSIVTLLFFTAVFFYLGFTFIAGEIQAYHGNE